MTKKNKMWDNSSLQTDEGWGNVPVGNMSDEELYKKNWNLIDANRQVVKDRLDNGWLEKNSLASKNRKPGYGEKISKTSKELRSNPEWKKQWKETIKKRNSDPEYNSKLKESIKQRSQDPIWIEANKQAQKKKYKKLQTPEGLFDCVKDAVCHYNLIRNRSNSESWLMEQRKKNPKDFYIIEK
jgi:hypothetical protein